MNRKPCVAGSFYQDNVKYLRESIEDCFKHGLGPGSIPKFSRVKKAENLNAIMVPHAGYVYSGPVASHAYHRLAESGFPETFVIIGPNHTGLGKRVSVFNEGTWEIPIGIVKVDNELADNIISKSNFAEGDFTAHLHEHSVEVQLPFLKYIDNDFKIVPICMMDQSYEAACDLANAIYDAKEELGRNIVIIDSTDLSHFKNQDLTLEHDNMVLDKIKANDARALFEVVRDNHISMCGYGPTMVAIEYSKKMSNKGFEFFKHSTSGDISGDYQSVVGYASGVWE